MRSARLLLASAACTFVAATASAQTATTTTTTRSSAGTTAQSGATQGAAASATSQPGATASNTTSGAMTSSGQPAAGDMTAAGGQADAAAAPAPSGAAFQPITPTAGADLLAVLQSSGQFTTLVKAITATNLTSVLQRPGSLTIFAPTDAAFAALPAGQLATMMQAANVTQLQQFVLLHVVNTPIKSSELLGHSAINEPTVATGKSVRLDGSSGAVEVDGLAVLQSDVKASNGTIFVIGKTLSPAYAPPAVKTTTTTTETKATTTRRKTH